MRDFLDWETMQAAEFVMAPPTCVSYRRSFESEVNTILREKVPKRAQTLSGTTVASFALHSGLLAQEPADFTDSGHVKPYCMNCKISRSIPYSITD
jgi:hypothetical protein